jgi:hypothetical protein
MAYNRYRTDRRVTLRIDKYSLIFFLKFNISYLSKQNGVLKNVKNLIKIP